MNDVHPAYTALVELHARLHRLQHLQSIAWWDQACNMPPKGNEARAAALAEIGTLMHRMRTDPALREQLDRAEQEPLDDDQRADLREMRREWRRANALPVWMVEAKTIATSRCEHAWRSQRPANDLRGFLENFRPVLDLARQEAACLADDSGLSRYDALLDRYEPGMTGATAERLFGEVRQWLPRMVGEAVELQSRWRVIELAGPFPKEAQRALNLEVMQRLGFDFDAGMLGESTHPFSGGVPEDVRMTTRYREDDFLKSLLATIHETGHARYEQNLPRPTLGQPVGRARSMGVHESQSLSFEMQLARSRPFAELLAPMLRKHLGDQRAFEPDNLRRLLTRVKPGLTRVDADELCYPAHVILRFEIERALIEGEIEAEDIAPVWDEKLKALLGLQAGDNFGDGCLQDVHWAESAFGYFPCYTLGAMYGAQWFAALRRVQTDLDDRIASGDLAVVFDWMRDNIWSQGSRWTTSELALRASGEPLAPGHYKAHLERRYLTD
ncbi:MAG TPA: carboxypeptidase M32 [Burkholderiaceae bacterium]|nr:carboxypeptidase M32 [Burkholderiaceae bacterium]